MAASKTGEKILRAFMRLVVKRGFDATTTRAVAKEAGVNEVTIFRLFSDKASLATEAFRFFNYETWNDVPTPRFPVATPRQAALGLAAHLRAMRDGAREHLEFIQFGMSEYWRLPDIREGIKKVALASRGFILEALKRAAPQLRPEVDLEAAAMELHAFIIMTVQWSSQGWAPRSEKEWNRLISAVVRPLVRSDNAVGRGSA